MVHHGCLACHHNKHTVYLISDMNLFEINDKKNSKNSLHKFAVSSMKFSADRIMISICIDLFVFAKAFFSDVVFSKVKLVVLMILNDGKI